MKYIVAGGQGFIGSHIVDALLKDGHGVTVIDNGLCGDNKNAGATYVTADIRRIEDIEKHFDGVDGAFCTAAIARTPWCIEDPVLCYETNVLGSLNVLEAARRKGVKRVVLSSSNIVYAAETPYKQSKLAMEAIAAVYASLYGLSNVCLRYSNVYGTRQREDGPSPNVFASFRKTLRETGHITLTGDGEQSRDFTHVSDVARANLLAMKSTYNGEPIDVCTGRNVTMNYVAKELFKAPIEYIGDRKGDIKHIIQKPERAGELLGWKPTVALEEGVKDVL
ncbi:MAG TPA: NAD-dependent epimerase/dehydratase family protein [Candidatus Paceibacterota bacterium]|nr:NAD-dependent epimerase/dehydratase family protein [Candidatus Paceibacterota bacterium]